MHLLTAWDKRLKGYPPRGDTLRPVDETTHLDEFVAYAVGVCRRFDNDVYLRVCAHGRGMDELPSTQGGNGLVFCMGDLGWERLSYLLPLKGKLRGGVDLYACGAAYINPGYGGHGSGDGNFFCLRMAQVLATNVRASSSKQTYAPAGGGLTLHPYIDFGPWEGAVYTYGPTGGLLKVEHGAAAAPLPDPLPA